MFHTWPVKISTMEPISTPSWRVGNSDTIASITPGRKLSTGIDCRMSSTASMTPRTRWLYAAMYPYVIANARLSRYATPMRTSEYSA